METAGLRPRETRIAALDALRGVLAMVVVVHHVFLRTGVSALQPAADSAVFAFFIMSGLVLARAYDGRPLAFLTRRAVRLWPTYAVCTFAGFATIGQLPAFSDLFWFPPLPLERLSLVNLPAWTLYVEVWGTPALIVMFWLARKSVVLIWLLATAGWLLVAWDPRLLAGPLFALGVALTTLDIAWPTRMPAWSLWLGKISFSLYISHWVVMSVLLLIAPVGFLPAAIPVCAAVAWMLWRWVERPSIALSRKAGAMALR